MIKFIRETAATLKGFWNAATLGQKAILLFFLMVVVYAISFQMGMAWAVNNFPF